MKKILGLDLGTSSIGWALVNEAETSEEKSSIIKLGVRVNPLTVDELQNLKRGRVSLQMQIGQQVEVCDVICSAINCGVKI